MLNSAIGILQSVFSNKGVEVKIRWQAILYLKNGVDRYWRRLSPGWVSINFPMSLSVW